eukprot:1191351-Prorocentrum_minimum.AAC.7
MLLRSELTERAQIRSSGAGGVLCPLVWTLQATGARVCPGRDRDQGVRRHDCDREERIRERDLSLSFAGNAYNYCACSLEISARECVRAVGHMVGHAGFPSPSFGR